MHETSDWAVGLAKSNLCPFPIFCQTSFIYVRIQTDEIAPRTEQIARLKDGPAALSLPVLCSPSTEKLSSGIRSCTSKTGRSWLMNDPHTQNTLPSSLFLPHSEPLLRTEPSRSGQRKQLLEADS